MIQKLKQFLSTRKLKKEAKDIGMSLSFKPSECGYYTSQLLTRQASELEKH